LWSCAISLHNVDITSRSCDLLLQYCKVLEFSREKSLRVGFVGSRGMVGSVLLDRMVTCGDLADIDMKLFSTSNAGGSAPNVEEIAPVLGDANCSIELSKSDIVLTCQGGEYTNRMLPRLRAGGWNGLWIDASSAMRMNDDTMLVLDPVNGDSIVNGLRGGVRSFAGANCTVSLMLMAMSGLIRAGVVDWISSMTYQAASGAGAGALGELVGQMGVLAEAGEGTKSLSNWAIDLDKRVANKMATDQFPTANFGVPLAGSAIPWIDSNVGNGQTREEWKGLVEVNKLLSRQENNTLPVDGLCVRIGAMRCHAQALTIKLNRDIPLSEVEALIVSGNEWVRLVENNESATKSHLTPAALAGSLDVAVGRVRKMAMGGEYLAVFTVGDQLLWGAAEPLRRMLNIAVEHADLWKS
jgi:aspartate-semialdehyde dehydrogenase